MKPTSEYKDVRWQKKRLAALEAANWTCYMCGKNSDTDSNQLHVHHKRYPKGKPVWDVEDSDLTVLCEPCHEKVTALKRNIGEIISEPDLYEGLKTIYTLAINVRDEFKTVSALAETILSKDYYKSTADYYADQMSALRAILDVKELGCDFQPSERGLLITKSHLIGEELMEQLKRYTLAIRMELGYE